MKFSITNIFIFLSNISFLLCCSIVKSLVQNLSEIDSLFLDHLNFRQDSQSKHKYGLQHPKAHFRLLLSNNNTVNLH